MLTLAAFKRTLKLAVETLLTRETNQVRANRPMAPSFQPRASLPGHFVGHFTALSSPGWGICGNRSARGWDTVKGKFIFSVLKDVRASFILNFLSAPNIKILNLRFQ